MSRDRFLNIYGWVLIGCFGGGLYTLYVVPKSEPGSPEMVAFGVIMTAWYLAAGTGILIRRLWGYYLLKSVLYLLLLSFPIGTYISYKSLKYIKNNAIKGEFST